MRRMGWVAVVLAGGVALFGAPAGANDDNEGSAARGGCSDRTIRGTYGIRMEGTRPAPPVAPGLPPQTESVVGVVTRTYDGQGGFTQIDNIKGSITGIVPDRPGAGTYAVQANCTGVTQFDPGTGIVIQEKFVIVSNGSEIFSFVASPPPVMVQTVQRKVR